MLVRDSALDIEQPDALLRYLRLTRRIGPAEQPEIRTLTGGVSNRTVMVERSTGEAWVLKQALRKLRVKVDWYSSPARIEREAVGLEWLARLAPSKTITPLVFVDYDNHLLAMSAVPRPHRNWKEMLLAGQLDWSHVEQFGQLLGTIHRRAYEERDEVARVFSDRSFFESLRLEPFYSFTAAQVPAAARFLAELTTVTRACRITLVHGDYSPKNILVYQDKLVLLDHEVIHYGDPAFDLGFSLAHLLSKAHHLRRKRRTFAEAAARYWSAYQQIVCHLDWHQELEARAIRHTLACLLARVAGRSPLEYLSAQERDLQQRVALSLISSAPASLPDLIAAFTEQLESDADY